MGAFDTPVKYTLKGTSGLIQQPDERGWDAVRGLYTQRRYEGDADVVAARFSELVGGDDSGADEIRESYDGRHGAIIMRIPDATDTNGTPDAKAITTIWEARRVEVLKPIETHSDFDAITAAKKAEILEAARGATAFSGTATEKSLYGYLCNQVLDYYEYAIALRKVETVTSRSALRGSWTDVNTVVTLASIGVPAGILSNLPASWEWLYRGADVTAQGRVFQITSEWLGALKWAKIYGGTWEPTI
jgi:hypothetical protein